MSRFTGNVFYAQSFIHQCNADSFYCLYSSSISPLLPLCFCYFYTGVFLSLGCPDFKCLEHRLHTDNIHMTIYLERKVPVSVNHSLLVTINQQMVHRSFIDCIGLDIRWQQGHLYLGPSSRLAQVFCLNANASTQHMRPGYVFRWSLLRISSPNIWSSQFTLC